MVIEIRARICKGNNKGVGFIRMPAQQRKYFRVNDNYRVKMVNRNSNLVFYGRIKDYSGLGIYVPKDLVVREYLIGKEFHIFFNKIDGFFTSVGGDGRLHIPRNVSEKMNLEHDEIVLISADIDSIKIERICRIKKRIYNNGTFDCYCFIGPRLSYKEGVFSIKRKLEKPDYSNKLSVIIKDMTLGLCGDDIIVFHGNKVPIKINDNLKIYDIVYYLGHFFADGTKKGNSWGLCISTFEQANAFLKIHKKLIPDASPEIYLSFSDYRNRSKSLTNIWYKKTGIKVKKIKFYKKDNIISENRNKFGTLVLREHRKLTQIYYNRLLDYVVEEIENGNKRLAIDFICGVLEGDGSPSSKSHGHIIISTNEEDAIKLERVLRNSNLKFKVCKEYKTKKVYIRIGSLSILNNLPVLKDKLFRYYPKRRKKFIERFSNVGAVKFILGKQKHASPWVKAYLKDNKILNEEYKLTKYGKDVKRCLEDMIKELKI